MPIPFGNHTFLSLFWHTTNHHPSHLHVAPVLWLFWQSHIVCQKITIEKSPFPCHKSMFSFRKSPISCQKSPTCEPYFRGSPMVCEHQTYPQKSTHGPPPLLPLPPPLQGETFYQKLLLIDYLSVYNTMLWPQMYAIYWYVYRSLLTEYRALLTAYRALLTQCRARMYAICC